MSASKDKKSNQNQGKKSMETGASNHLSDAADVYYGRGVRITRGMKANMEAKSPCKNVSAQLGAKKITSLNNGLSVRSSPRRKSGATEQDGQQKKQKAATSAGEQTKGMESKKKKAQKKELKRTTDEKNKAPKKHKPNPSCYEPSARQLRVLRSLALVAPLGSPFHKR